MLAETPTTHTLLALCTGVLVAAGLCLARSVFAPVAFSVLIIAVVWPLQQLLATRIPRLAASVVVMAITLLVIVALAAVVAWGFSMIGEWMVHNAGQFQSLHLQASQWLMQHGI